MTFSHFYLWLTQESKIKPKSPALESENSILYASDSVKTLNQKVPDGPDVIRTHDLPVISRAHHRAMLRAQKIALIYPNNYSTRVFIGCE